MSILRSLPRENCRKYFYHNDDFSGSFFIYIITFHFPSNLREIFFTFQRRKQSKELLKAEFFSASMICVLFMRSLLIFIMLQDFLLIPMSLLTLYNSLCFLQHQWVLDCTLKIVMYREKFKIILQFLFSRRDKIVLQKHKTISFPFSLSYPEEQFLSKF